FTLLHEAPVLCAAFSINSDLLITGSMDSTIRIWSSRRGEPLFQINLPDPPLHLEVDYQDRLYSSCSNRILVFTIKPLFKENELPNYWQTSEIQKKLSESNRAGKSNARDAKPETPGIALSELRKLIAHGVVMPDTIEDICLANDDIDMKQLYLNMKRYNIFPQQILRIIAQSKFMPRDVLKALSSKNAQTVMALIAQGLSVTTYMLQKGYRLLAPNEDPVLTINLHNLTHPDQVVPTRNSMTAPDAHHRTQNRL
ncbi:hypothetical protein HDU91_000993, partial [Kappamyces sp. JEL0680]